METDADPQEVEAGINLATKRTTLRATPGTNWRPGRTLPSMQGIMGQTEEGVLRLVERCGWTADQGGSRVPERLRSAYCAFRHRRHIHDTVSRELRHLWDIL